MKTPDDRCLVIIDHADARIFPSVRRGTAAYRITPFKRDNALHRAHDDWHSREFSREQKTGVRNFFASVAKALPPAGEILLFGTGKGGSSEMDRFIGWQRQRHPELSARIVGARAVDQHHLTEAQLLAVARDFSSTRGRNDLRGKTIVPT